MKATVNNLMKMFSYAVAVHQMAKIKQLENHLKTKGWTKKKKGQEIE